MLWKLWFTSAFAGVLLIVGSGRALAGGAEIWIAVRTDGIAGSGTTVHLGRGLFQTTGAAGYNPKGYYLPPGTKIIGAGIDLTTVQCVLYPLAAGVNGHFVFESPRDADGAGTEVTDLTVDCNWQNLAAPSASKIGAVSLSGNNCAIRRVRAINAYGN